MPDITPTGGSNQGRGSISSGGEKGKATNIEKTSQEGQVPESSPKKLEEQKSKKK